MKQLAIALINVDKETFKRKTQDNTWYGSPPLTMNRVIKKHICVQTETKTKGKGEKRGKNCKLCNDENRRKTTSFRCKECEIPLCNIGRNGGGSCFQRYHEAKEKKDQAERMNKTSTNKVTVTKALNFCTDENNENIYEESKTVWI